MIVATVIVLVVSNILLWIAIFGAIGNIGKLIDVVERQDVSIKHITGCLAIDNVATSKEHLEKVQASHRNILNQGFTGKKLAESKAHLKRAEDLLQEAKDQVNAVTENT